MDLLLFAPSLVSGVWALHVGGAHHCDTITATIPRLSSTRFLSQLSVSLSLALSLSLSLSVSLCLSLCLSLSPSTPARRLEGDGVGYDVGVLLLDIEAR